MSDSALDFITFFIVLSIVSLLSFRITIPIVKESKEIYYSEIQDKTVGRPDGELVTLDKDEFMSKNEVMLLMIGQNQFMPAPGKILICGEEVKVTDNLSFSPNSAELGAQVNSIIEDWYTKFSSSSIKNKFENAPKDISEARFKLMFDMNDANNKDDDSYSLYIKLKPVGKLEQVYKCEPNGGLIERGGKTVE